MGCSVCRATVNHQNTELESNSLLQKNKAVTHVPNKLIDSCNLCVVKKERIKNLEVISTEDSDSDVGRSPWDDVHLYESDEDSLCFHSVYDNISQDKNHKLLLRNPSLIDRKYAQELLKLIKPLQNTEFNYRNPQFMIAERAPKPKLQTIISQIRHYRQYKPMLNDGTDSDILSDSDSDDLHNHIRRHWGGARGHVLPRQKEIAIGSTPTIFCNKQQKFITEINGLLYKDNIKLYSVIQNIFIKFIPMFEWCLGMTFTEHKQLSVIIKIQDYQFSNANQINGKWHSEGDKNDHIIGVGVYYFDITGNEQLKFEQNRLEIAEREISSLQKQNIAKIKVENNDCIVFKNSRDIQHRAVISTQDMRQSKGSAQSNLPMISRKMLTFFVMNPNNKSVASQSAYDFKFINFPWKVHVFVKHFTGYNMGLYEQIPSDLIVLIKLFTFGSEKYLQNDRVKFELNKEPAKLYAKSNPNPFYRRRVEHFGCMN